MDPWLAALLGALGATTVFTVVLLVRERQASTGVHSLRRPSSAAAELVPLVFAPVAVLRDVIGAAIPEIRSFLSPGGTVALLFSDIAGSTAMNDDLGDHEWARLLRSHDGAARAVVRAEGGRVVKTQGDGFMAVFHDAPSAVAAAVGLEEAVRDSSMADLRLRVGIHLGEVVSERGDYFGTNVVVAARVAGAAQPGQVLVTDQVARRLVGDERFSVRAKRLTTRLRGLDGRRRLHVVRAA